MTLTNRTVALLFGLEALFLGFCVFALADRHLHQRIGLRRQPMGYAATRRAARKSLANVAWRSSAEAPRDEAALEYTSTLAGTLFLELRQAGAPVGEVYSVVNLSEPRAGADSYIDTLRRYEYLEPDVVCVFDGYDALAGLPPHARRRSAAFRATGYLPMLAARLLRRPEWMSDRDGGIAEMLRDDRADPADVGCAGASASYCAAMADTVRFARGLGHSVLVVSPPSVSARHAQQQRSLGTMLSTTFGGDPGFSTSISDRSSIFPIRSIRPIGCIAPRSAITSSVSGSRRRSCGRRI